MRKTGVAVLGATGAVGQRFIQLLEDHPWFEVSEVIASERSAGKAYGEAANWVLDGEPPSRVAQMTVKPLDSAIESALIFSALPKEAAQTRELELAAEGHLVCTNASAHRMAADVPLLLPEVNAEHLGLIEVQRHQRRWSGALVANSNCTVMPVVMAFAPLLKYGLRQAHIVSMQAISGAGYPGVASLDILDNVIPFIAGEEPKLEAEARKMLGQFDGERIVELEAVLSAVCTRVPVVDGHLVNVSLDLEHKPTCEAIIAEWQAFRGGNDVANLPTAPQMPLNYLTQPDRPQPRRDRNAGSGMSTSIGRLRECPVLGYKFAALSHNTIRGAAGCSILNAELLVMKGYLSSVEVPIQAVVDSLPAHS